MAFLQTHQFDFLSTLTLCGFQTPGLNTPHWQNTSMYGNLMDWSELRFRASDEKRIRKWTNEKPECDHTDRSATCCCQCVIGHDLGTALCPPLLSAPGAWAAYYTAGFWKSVCLRAVLNMKENRCPLWTCLFEERDMWQCPEGSTHDRNIFHTDCGWMEVPITAVITMFSIS